MAAYEILRKINKDGAYSNIAVNAVSEDLNVRNRRFVRELVYGVIRMKNRLDFYIGQLVRNGIGSIRDELLVLLESGVYQIMFMDSVPDHSAVDETVKIAKREFHGKSGFINGVLRNFLRKRDELNDPDEIRDPIARMNAMYSADESIIRLLIDQYGEAGADSILAASLNIAPLFIRVNTIKISMDDALKELSESAEAYDEELGLIRIKGHAALDNSVFEKGKFFVQDASSARAVRRFDPKPGDFVVDVCAAPGGKSFGMACRMENRGEIHAFDLRKSRTKLIERGVRELGIDIIQTGVHDASEPIPEYRGKADKVLCDVPCSGLGDMSRKPEIRYKDISDLKRLYDLQLRILETSSEYVKPGGRIMYSTCTINKLENQEITNKFLAEHDEFEIIESRVLVPGLDAGNTKDEALSAEPGTAESLGGSQEILKNADGFYYCIMERKRNS